MDETRDELKKDQNLSGASNVNSSSKEGLNSQANVSGTSSSMPQSGGRGVPPLKGTPPIKTSPPSNGVPPIRGGLRGIPPIVGGVPVKAPGQGEIQGESEEKSIFFALETILLTTILTLVIVIPTNILLEKYNTSNNYKNETQIDGNSINSNINRNYQ